MEVTESGGAAGLKQGTRVAVKRFTDKKLKKAGLEVVFAAPRSTIVFCCHGKSKRILLAFVLRKTFLRVEPIHLNNSASFVAWDFVVLRP